MGILARLTSEPRSPGASRVPYAGRTLAGVVITPDTAVTIPTVWACLRYLSQTVANLPWHVMRKTTEGRKPAPNHVVDWLVAERPNPEWSSFQFRETLVHWALRWGNGYAEIERDVGDRPASLWPLHPDRVAACRALDATEDAYGYPINAGDLYYEVDNGTSGKTVLAARNMFHVRGFGEGPIGVNVINYAAQSIGWARAAQLFGASFFGNGMNPAGVVINKKPLKKEGLERQKAEFEQLYKGPRNANRTAFLDNEAEWKAIGFNPRESQLIDVHQHLVEEICRWFGVPPHKVMHLLRATFSNIEHQAIEVVVDSISPWVTRFEDEADYKLFGEVRSRGFYTKMNMNALLRGDMKARVDFYKGMQFVGAYSPNKILELEDENGLGEEGEIHVMQEQMTTLDRIANPPDPVAAAPTAPVDPSADPSANDPAAQNIAKGILEMLGEPEHVG